MQDNTSLENEFEKPPIDQREAEARYDQWNAAMSNGVPEFAGDNMNLPVSEIPDAPDASPATADSLETLPTNEDNKGIADAAAIINYVLDAVARKNGVESVIQGIKTFDPTGSSDPIRDLYNHLGINTPEEFKEIREENIANQSATSEFRNNMGISNVNNRSHEGAFKAIADMQDLITAVENADPRYEAIREGAKSAGKGYFEYAVGFLEKPGLIELFGVLKDQHAPTTSEQNTTETKNEVQEESSAEDSNLENPDDTEATVDTEEQPEVIEGAPSPEAPKNEETPEIPQNEGEPKTSQKPTDEFYVHRETLNPDITNPNTAN